MKRFKKHVITAAVFAGLAIAGTIMSTHPASATNPVPGSAPVNIVSPVPLPVQGTVDIGNFPSSLPVSFSSTTSSPLYIRDVDSPAHNAFAHYLNCVIDPGQGTCSAQFTVPTGKALVIETISAGFGVPQEESGWVEVNFLTNGAGMTVVLPGTSVGPSSGPFTFHAVTQPVRLYVDPGSPVIAHFYVTPAVPANLGPVLTMWVSGHFVSCGAGTGCPLP